MSLAGRWFFKTRRRHLGAPEARHICRIIIQNEPSSVRSEIVGEYAAPTELAMSGGVGATKIPLLTELEPFVSQTHVCQLVENLFLRRRRGDESQILRFLRDKLETPYVVSYFFNRLLWAALSRCSSAQGKTWAGLTVVLSEQVGGSPISPIV